MATDDVRQPSRRAFSLIELVAVLALAAILTASAALALGSFRRQAALKDAARQIEWADALVRSNARTTGVPASMQIDLASGRVTRDASTLAELPAGVRIERLEIAGHGTGYGGAGVPFTSNGQTPSYAVELLDTTGRRDWLVVAGLTGQVTHVDERSIDELLASAPFRGGADAD